MQLKKINKTKNRFYGKNYKIDKFLARPITKIRKSKIINNK